MAESDELITLRSEVDSLRMAIFQLQSERGGAGGGMGGDFFPIGDFAAGGGGGESGGGGTAVDSEALVGMSLDYVDKESDEDFEEHAYAIRLKRGRLQLVNGVLTIKEVKDKTQFVETTPFDNRYE